MQIIGHRGAAGLAPENTIASIKAALEQGVDWIEFDVRATRDGQVVVIHDSTIDRIAIKHGRVRDLTLEQLRAIPTKSGEPIPTISEMLEAIGANSKVVIELKTTGCTEAVVKEIHARTASGQDIHTFLVISFKASLLKEIHALDPNVPLGLLHHVWPFTFTATNIPLKAVAFYHRILPSLTIRLARKRGLLVCAYTINSTRRADRLAKRGVDSIVTDNPQIFRP